MESVSLLKKRKVWGRGDHAHLLEFYFPLPWCCYCGVWHRCKWQNLYSAFLDKKSGRETNLLLWECVAPADTSHTPNPTPSPHLRQAASPPPMRSSVGVNLRPNGVGWSGRAEAGGPVCSTLVLSNLHRLLLNTKHRSRDAQSRARGRGREGEGGGEVPSGSL